MMRTKEKILGQFNTGENISAEQRMSDAIISVAEVLIDIRDILETRLQDVAEPLKHQANQNGGRF